MKKINKKSAKKTSKNRKPRKYKNLIKNFSPFDVFKKSKSKLPDKYVGKDNIGIGTDGGTIFIRSPNGTPTSRLHQMLEQALTMDTKDIKITFIPDANKNVEYGLNRKPPPAKEDDEIQQMIRASRYR